MSDTADLLLEIGCEELPPRALRPLADALGRELVERLAAAGIGCGEHAVFATPRRIATLVRDVETSQPDREVERRGPSVDIAFDSDGNPTKAAEGFARSVGVDVAQLERLENDDGAWLLFRTTEVGGATSGLLPGLVGDVIARLPVPRRMRWADLDVEFSRPVHWVVLMLGPDVVEAEILGVDTGRFTYGHRYHKPEGLRLEEPGDYANALYANGQVVPDLDARREMIRQQVEEAAGAIGGTAVIDDALLEENAALVEWPTAVTGSFDAGFLELPDAVLEATMKGHQRYFPVADSSGKLMASFIAVSNIESRNPDAVRAGNERVIRPRLADARFFFEADAAKSLDERQAGLKDVVFQDKLGTLHDKAERVSRLAGVVAIALGVGPDEVKLARRAGLLCKCDLLTQMVGEFPELQGTIGGEYARRGGEPDAVADAIAESYMPRFAGDAIPATRLGRALAIADKLDSLVGIFAVGEAPTGDKDPYALRRAAIGVLRIVIEGELALDLSRLVQGTVDNFKDAVPAEGVADQVREFMTDRLRAYFAERGVPIDVFQAVQARGPARPLDFARRVEAVDAFAKLPEAQSLAAANKRIQNILRQADGVPAKIDESLYSEDAEWNLAAKLVGLGPRVREMLKQGDYTGALTSLASLRENVDSFFDSVKVMDDDEKVRGNRLALLNEMSELFLATADVSRLQTDR